ncbi:MAG: PPOX class F420-dependent oxidoreductase, partial [Roseiflexaceae bacterium]
MDGFADLVTHQYINLITYRKSGETVATPVWFVYDNHRLYVGTGRNAGKIKRIRNNPQVQIEACDARGTPLGARITAHARVLAVVLRRIATGTPDVAELREEVHLADAPHVGGDPQVGIAVRAVGK